MEKKNESLTLKEFLKTLIWIFKTYYKTSPSKTILLLITRVIRDMRGLVYGAFLAKILDQLVTLSQNEVKDFEVLVPTLLGLLLYYVFVTGLVNNIFQYSYRGLKQVSRSKLEILFAEQLNYLGIQNLENPDVINRVQRASQWVYETFQTLNDSLFFISNIVQVFVSGAVILSFFPLMIPILLVLTIIKFFPDRYFIKKDFHWQTDNTEKRRIAYSSIVAAQNPSDLQEISIVGGYDFFVQKYENFSKWFNDGLLKIIKEREIVNFK